MQLWLPQALRPDTKRCNSCTSLVELGLAIHTQKARRSSEGFAIVQNVSVIAVAGGDSAQTLVKALRQLPSQV